MIRPPSWPAVIARTVRDARLRVFTVGLVALGMAAATAPASVAPQAAAADHGIERPATEPPETVESGDEDHFHHDEPPPVTPAVDTPAGLNEIGAASPWAGRWGPEIEPLATYEAQRTCIPGARPAVAAFASLLERAYPQSRGLGIARDCAAGNRSEHKEGRAYDWGVNLTVPAEREAAHQVIAWLLATDEHGNDYAMARRLGVMYVIWDNHIWSSSAAQLGWRVYTGVSPHTDHVHLSFNWDGARGATSFWDATNFGFDVGPWLFGGFSMEDFPSGFDLGRDRYRRELGAAPGEDAPWHRADAAGDDPEPDDEGGDPGHDADDGGDARSPGSGAPAPAPDPADGPSTDPAPTVTLPEVTVPDLTEPIDLSTTTTLTVPLLDEVVDEAEELLDPLASG